MKLDQRTLYVLETIHSIFKICYLIIGFSWAYIVPKMPELRLSLLMGT